MKNATRGCFLKSRYIAFGTDAEYFQPTGTPLEKESPYILCVGYNKRDWDTLLQAYEKLEKSAKRAKSRWTC